jgi:hypothetical protein
MYSEDCLIGSLTLCTVPVSDIGILREVTVHLGEAGAVAGFGDSAAFCRMSRPARLLKARPLGPALGRSVR